MTALLAVAVMGIGVPFSFDGIQHRVVLRATDRHPLQVWLGGVKIDEVARREWEPWRFEVGDVDGDGRTDFLVGLRKSTPRMPWPHTTIFVYSFDGKAITKKWLGSTMGRDLVDFCLGEQTPAGGRSLYTLERTLEGEVELSRYQWSGFGFGHAERGRRWPEAGRAHFDGLAVHVRAGGAEARILPEELR